MRRDRDSDADGGPRGVPRHRSLLRTAGLTVGFLLAVAATVVVFVTDDPQHLRVAVVGAAWAFVLAALAPTRRAEAPGDGDGDAGGRAAAEQEMGVRPASEVALAREAAVRRGDELRSEAGLRREAEESVRAQLDALRGELAEVVLLRRDMGEIAQLRREVAQLAELRGGLVQLPDLRHDVAQLRADVGILRAELSGEMLVERVMLRTQSIRTGPSTAEPPVTRTVDAWSEPAPALPGAPAVTHDDLDPPVAPRSGEQRTVQRPVVQRARPPVPGSGGASARPDEPGEGPSRPAQVRAEAGAAASSGGRRRRRYGDDGGDDVLSRVLGRD